MSNSRYLRTVAMFCPLQTTCSSPTGRSARGDRRGPPIPQAEWGTEVHALVRRTPCAVCRDDEVVSSRIDFRRGRSTLGYVDGAAGIRARAARPRPGRRCSIGHGVGAAGDCRGPTTVDVDVAGKAPAWIGTHKREALMIFERLKERQRAERDGALPEVGSRVAARAAGWRAVGG